MSGVKLEAHAAADTRLTELTQTSSRFSNTVAKPQTGCTMGRGGAAIGPWGAQCGRARRQWELGRETERGSFLTLPDGRRVVLAAVRRLPLQVRSNILAAHSFAAATSAHVPHVPSLPPCWRASQRPVPRNRRTAASRAGGQRGGHKHGHAFLSAGRPLSWPWRCCVQVRPATSAQRQRPATTATATTKEPLPPAGLTAQGEPASRRSGPAPAPAPWGCGLACSSMHAHSAGARRASWRRRLLLLLGVSSAYPDQTAYYIHTYTAVLRGYTVCMCIRVASKPVKGSVAHALCGCEGSAAYHAPHPAHTYIEYTHSHGGISIFCLLLYSPCCSLQC